MYYYKVKKHLILVGILLKLTIFCIIVINYFPKIFINIILRLDSVVSESIK